MDYTRLQRSINFKPRHMKFFQDNKSDIQEFTRDAVDREIQRIKDNYRGEMPARPIKRELEK